MLSDSRSLPSFGQFDEELHLPDEAKHHLFGFVTNELVNWRDHPDRPHQTSEVKLTAGFCSHLNTATRRHESWNRVSFQVEEPDETKGNRNIDLAAKPCSSVIFIEGKRHTQFDMLFPIECKILPTPTGIDRDEREYVISDRKTTGGIHRFKVGNHGAIHDFAAMIGYIQEGDAAHWLKKVNEWIGELSGEAGTIWSQDEKLSMVNRESSEVSSLKSNHDRSSGKNAIALRHAWIRMN